jgi:hypothetical protein
MEARQRALELRGWDGGKTMNHWKTTGAALAITLVLATAGLARLSSAARVLPTGSVHMSREHPPDPPKPDDGGKRKLRGDLRAPAGGRRIG